MPDQPDPGKVIAQTGCAMMACPFAILFGILLLVFVYAMGRTLLGI